MLSSNLEGGRADLELCLLEGGKREGKGPLSRPSLDYLQSPPHHSASHCSELLPTAPQMSTSTSPCTPPLLASTLSAPSSGRCSLRQAPFKQRPHYTTARCVSSSR